MNRKSESSVSIAHEMGESVVKLTLQQHSKAD